MHSTYPKSVCIGLLWVVFAHVCLAQLPEVPEAAIEALGITEGTQQSRGFVFIAGRYLAPPYTVMRKGNGIFINRVQVEQPFSWPVEALMPSASLSIKKATEEPEKKDAEKDNILSAAPVREATEDSTNMTALAEGSPVEAQGGNTLDLLFNDASSNSAVEKKTSPVVLAQKQKDELRQKLDRIRLYFEAGLSQGEIFLFNNKNGRINGTYGTAKTLFAVLPEAVRYSQSPQDLMARLNQGGVFFLDGNACEDLYRNKLNFMVLSERRRDIEFSEEKKNPLRSR